jgi:hypothetical protein
MSLDTSKPLYKAGRELAHKLGWTQEEWSAVLGAYAQGEAASFNDWNQRVEAELESLGENREARLLARDNFIDSTGAEAFKEDERKVAIDNIKGMPWSRYMIRWVEHLNAKTSRQGVTPYSAAGREANEGRADGLPDNWDKLDAVTRRQWMLQHPEWRARAV